MNTNSIGILYVVATPIGNLQDITLRAIDVLKTVNLIVAEDTRHSQPLLKNYSIHASVLAFHEHNEREFSQKLLEKLKQGESIALISDAGTPLISDPGFYLVREALREGIKVMPIPGACAAIAALSASGLPTDRFSFEGFLPQKEVARLKRLEALRQEPRTMVFYEAPHRILGMLTALKTVFGDEREVVLAREITKLFETIKSSSLKEMVEWVASDPNQQRGELVVLLAGAPELDLEHDKNAEEILAVLLEELPLKQAVDLAVKLTGQKKNELYQLALRIQGK